jgi:hypothetical protein
MVKKPKWKPVSPDEVREIISNGRLKHFNDQNLKQLAVFITNARERLEWRLQRNKTSQLAQKHIHELRKLIPAISAGHRATARECSPANDGSRSQLNEWADALDRWIADAPELYRPDGRQRSNERDDWHAMAAIFFDLYKKSDQNAGISSNEKMGPAVAFVINALKLCGYAPKTPGAVKVKLVRHRKNRDK